MCAVPGTSRTPRRRWLAVAVACLSVGVLPRVAAAQGSLTNGENHSGAISAPGETDSWTFVAQQGDAIALSAGEVGPDSAFWPWIRLRAPDGTQIGSAWGALVAQVNVTAPQTGTYTVVLASADSGNDDTGAYLLTLAHTPGAFVVPAGDQGGPMTNGENHAGAIHRGDLDQWTFTAAAGAAISLSVGEVGADSGFWPWIRLRAPDGSQIGNAWNPLVAQVNVTAPASGTYTVLIGTADSGHDETADYLLTLAMSPGTFIVPEDDQGGPMTNGANHSGAIHRGDLDQWTFSAAAGAAISVSLGEVGADSAFWPWIRLRAPDGSQIGNAWNPLVAQINATAPAAGIYTVVVASADSGNDATASYLLTLAMSPGTFVVPDGDQGGTVTNGANHPGTIHRGDLDQWNFTATAGASISLSVGEVGADSGFWPWIRLRGPDGGQIGNDWSALVAQINVTAPSTGTYTVIVGSADSGNDETADYLLTLALTPGSFVIPDGDQGGPMVNAVSHQGAVHRGDLDQWTFTAVAGAALTLSIGETGGDSAFWPWIRLRRPDGAQIGNTWGALSAQINVTAPATGLYTVVVASADSGNDDTGNYQLQVQGASTPPTTFTVTPSAGANGSISPNTPQTVTSGSTVTFTITPAAGYVIGSVGGTCGGSLNGQAYTTLAVTANCTVSASFSPVTTNPTMSLDSTALYFAALFNGTTFLSQTSAQVVRLSQNGSGNVTWTATSNRPWLTVTPASGTGAANLTVSVAPASGVPSTGSVGGAITLTFTGAANTAGPINVVLTTLAPNTTQDPFGTVDTPVDNSTGVTGAVPFTGWGLDDLEVAGITICRDAVAGEGAGPDSRCGGAAKIYVGDAVFIKGARPDVQAGYGTYPRSSEAGWGFMVLTNMLPNQGNGTFVFTIYARDREGHVRVLGARTLTCTNATATKPFGTIDTPGQGATTVGSSYVNFGWALTQNPKFIPQDGSTITVWVDGVAQGSPSYNHFRSDIATLFPGLANSNGAVGFKILDTTKLSNGLHTIVWTASDSAGQVAGLGSRFFRVANSGTAVTAAASRVALPALSSSGIEALPVDTAPVLVRRGWDAAAPLHTYAVGAAGRAVIRGEELDRFDLELGTDATYTGYLRVGDALSDLPIGSRLDGSTFLWSPGVGFVGRYDFVFVRSVNGAAVSRRNVRIILQPKGHGHAGPQVMIDAPAAPNGGRVVIDQPFRLAGWAADLDAPTGTGIGTVHVWAYPTDGSRPVFLGAATLGGIRPDVGAVHGEQFLTAGYGLTVQGLSPGDYDLAVFGWTQLSGGFAPAKVVGVTVR